MNRNPLKKELKLKSSGKKVAEIEDDNLSIADVPSGKKENFDFIKMTSKPNIMRQLIELNSKVIIRNEINPNIKIMFKNNINNSNSITLRENDMAPLPFDKVDDKIKFSVNTKKGKSFDGKWFCAKDIASNASKEVVNYKVGDAFAFNMFVEDFSKSKSSEDGEVGATDVRKIIMVPPVIIKNKILTNLNFYVVKKNFEQVYGEKHKIKFDEDDYEIYEVLDKKLKIRLGINGLKSDIIDIDVSKQDIVTEKSVWINKKGRKAINVHLLGRFERGSYILDVYMKAMLVDELFMELKYSQNIGTHEEVIYPINKTIKDELGNVQQSKDMVSTPHI